MRVEIGRSWRREKGRKGGKEREKQAERKRGLKGWVSEEREDAKDQCNDETGRAEPENSRGIHRRDAGYTIAVCRSMNLKGVDIPYY